MSNFYSDNSFVVAGFFRFSSTPRRWIIVKKNCVIPVFFNATALDYCIEKLRYSGFL